MISQVADIINNNRSFLVTSHANPDGDAVGCLLGCGSLLRRLGKEVTLYGPSGIPELFRFLSLTHEVDTHLDPAKSYDASLVFDTADPDLLGDEFPSDGRQGTVVVLDHHLRFKEYGDVIWRDPEASAAGVLLFRLAEKLGVTGDRPLGKALWCALYTDTGGFRYSSTNAETLHIAGDLLSWGVDPWEMALSIYESNPAGRVRLLAKVLSTLEVSSNGKVALILAPKKFLKEEGMDPSMLDTFINHARGIKGVEVAIQISERTGGWKASLRSKGRVDVSALASRHGGGGHRNAAGCFFRGEISSIKESLMKEAEQLTQNISDEPQ
jgi:bifunctional oligoribonuclease and PAP phosphatase NrnA